MPDMAIHIQANRAFLYRTVRYPSELGVRQFLDIGARVVYVDIDPVAVARSRAILATLDFDQPIGLLMLAILPAVSDQDDPHGLVGRLTEELVPGSYLAVSHATADSLPEVWDRRKD